MKYTGTLIATQAIEKSKHFYHDVLGLDAVIARFVAQGLSPEETAVRMDIPLDFVVSSLNGSK